MYQRPSHEKAKRSRGSGRFEEQCQKRLVLSGRFDPHTKRRSLLAQGCELPSKLIKETSGGRSRSVEVSNVMFIAGGEAKQVSCVLGGATAWVHPRTAGKTLEVSVHSAGTRDTYTIGLDALVSATMEIRTGSRVADVHGVVAISLFFVVAGDVQIISFVPLRNDQSACVMLANLDAMKQPLIGASSTGFDSPPIEVELPLSWCDADSNVLVSSTGSGSMMMQCLKTPWEELPIANAILEMPGLLRLISYHEGMSRRHLDVVALNCGSKDAALSFTLMEKSSREKKKGNKNKSRSARRGQQLGVREVNAWMEEEDEIAVLERNGLTRLEQKYVGLSAHSPADGDFGALTGEIIGFEWRDDTSPPQWVAEIQDPEGDVTPFTVLELPEMIKAAKQTDDVLIHFEEPDDGCDEIMMEKASKECGAITDDESESDED